MLVNQPPFSLCPLQRGYPRTQPPTKNEPVRTVNLYKKKERDGIQITKK